MLFDPIKQTVPPRDHVIQIRATRQEMKVLTAVARQAKLTRQDLVRVAIAAYLGQTKVNRPGPPVLDIDPQDLAELEQLARDLDDPSEPEPEALS